mgnify:CR=1 FL=1
MTEKTDNLIETFDEEGNKVSFELLDIVSVDDIEYALLLPVDYEEDSEENEVLVMRLKKEGEDFSFEAIEDDDEFNKIAQYIEELEDELDE